MNKILFAVFLVTAVSHAGLRLQCEFKDKDLKLVTRYRVAADELGKIHLYTQELEQDESGRLSVICNNFADETTLETVACDKSEKDESDLLHLKKCLDSGHPTFLTSTKTYGLHPKSQQKKFHRLVFESGYRNVAQQDWFYGRNVKNNGVVENYDYSKVELMTCRWLELE